MPGSLQMQHQLMNAMEPAIRTEILETVPAIARTIRHAAMIGALIGMGYDPACSLRGGMGRPLDLLGGPDPGGCRGGLHLPVRD